MNITKLHFFENVITVTQDGQGEWEDIEPAVIETVRENIADHDPDFKDGITEEERRAGLPADILEIEEILDNTVRSGLQADGGDVVVRKYDRDANIVYVQYQGACTTCPSSSLGTMMAIKNFLKAEFDPNIDVKIVEEGAEV